MFCTNPIPFLLVATAVFFVASVEYFALFDDRRIYPSVAAAVAFALLAWRWPQSAVGTTDFIVLGIGLAAAVAAAVSRLSLRAAKQSNWYLTLSEALGWIAAPLLALSLLHGPGSSTLWNFKSPLLLILVPVWAGDIAGILVGLKWGRHKLAPQISPKKTVEGAVANLVFAALAGGLIGPYVGIPVNSGIGCGVIAGIFGQAGDLFESWIKRKVGKKDSGTLLPGHGGVLDRIDSLLFAAIPICLFLALIVK